jgi:type VI secretion system protein ImpF
MSRVPPQSRVLSSVLDRLTEGTSSPGRGQSLRDLKLCVRRDLENLLNTRWRCKCWPPELDEELEQSLVSYGIPDFTAANLSDPRDREEFRRILERAIRNFEPRFVSVTVVMKDLNPLERTLKFQIDAKLMADPEPERVVFDTALEATTATFRVGKAEQ